LIYLFGVKFDGFM